MHARARLTPTVLLLGAASLLSLACAPAQHRLGSEARAAVVEPDPADRRASSLRGRCASRDLQVKRECYQRLILGIVDAEGVRPALELLERLARIDADVRHQAHVYAHHVGLAAYSTPAEVGERFRACTPAFQSGCYHGVIQAYFADLQQRSPGAALGAEQLHRLCAEYRSAGEDRWLLFQCVHGMGHGLVALHAHHLPRALQACDLLQDAWEREGCYGGAFMENIVHATMPHHAAAPLGAEPHGHGGHAHHHAEADESEGAAAASSAPLDPDDPHYPCSVVAERHLHACYLMQTSAVLFASGGEIAPALELCLSAPSRVRYACFVSLGRDINAYTAQDHRLAIERCQLAPEAFRPACIIGVAKNLIDVSADPKDGLAFCDRVEESRARLACFQAVGEQIAVLEPHDADRELSCRGAGPAEERACRLGAQLPDSPAAGSF